MKLKRIFFVLVMTILLVTPVLGETEQEQPRLYAQSAVLIDGDSGRVLYGKGEDLVRPMASTTKIMTCILALENGSMEDVVTASSYAASQPKVHLGIQSGQQFYLKDLLYSLMLESHNDSAVMIAEHIGTDVEGFAQMMNQKARDIGCKHTNFITPNGLDAEKTLEDGTTVTHSTTATELAMIMRYCISESPKKEEFIEITRTGSYYFKSVSGKQSYSCANHNALLTMMNGVISGKTGFTNGAGYSYVGVMQSEGRTYILALLGCGWPPHKTYKWSDARALFHYGTEYYHYKEVFEDLEELILPVTDGIPESGQEQAFVELTLGLSEEEKTLKILMHESETVHIQKNLPTNLKAPVTEKQVVGSVDYYLGEYCIRSWPVFAEHKVDVISAAYYWRKLWQYFTV